MMYNNKAQGLEEGGSFSAIDARKAYNLTKLRKHIPTFHPSTETARKK